MAEYTYEDIIMDPEDPRLEGAIGKECYFSDVPNFLLDYARDNSIEHLSCLKKINKEEHCPFIDKKNETPWFLIIIKKEEPKPKYVPFESMDEFLERYTESKERAEFGSFEGKLNQYGMWLKDTDRDVYCLVTEIWNYGVVVGDSNMNTTKDGDEYFTMNGVTKWKQLFMEYTFLNDTPCGKEVKE